MLKGHHNRSNECIQEQDIGRIDKTGRKPLNEQGKYVYNVSEIAVQDRLLFVHNFLPFFQNFTLFGRPSVS